MYNIIITQVPKEESNKSLGAISFPSRKLALGASIWIKLTEEECFTSVCKYP
tara:strand:- start:276 stop:431 length:156 start_codon:yes stop_codon:yes gene_type:complete